MQQAIKPRLVGLGVGWMLFFSFTLYLSNSIVPIFDGIGRSDLVVYSILISTALASVLGGCVALLFPKTLRHPLKILGLLLIGSALFGCTSLIAIPELADWLIAKAEPSSIFSHVDQLSLFFQLIVYYLLLLGPPIILFISGMGLWLAISFSKQTSTEKRYGIILGSCILGMVMGISYSLFVDKDAFYTLYGTHPWVHWIVMLLIGIGIICASTRSTFKKNTHKENDTVKNGKPHSHLIKRITQSPLSDGSQRYLRGVIAVLTMVIGCSFVCFLLTHMPSILISLPNSLHYSAIQLVSLPILGSIILGLLILQIFPLRFYLLPILTVGTIALSIIFLLDYLMLSHISNGIPLGVNPIDGNLKLGGLSQLLPWSIPQGVLLGILLPILLVTFLALGPRTLRSIAQWIICLGIGMATGITLFVFMDGNQNLFLSSILFLIPLTIVLGIMLIISATIPLRNLIQQPSIIFCILFLVFTSGLLILFPRPSVMFADKRSHPVEPFPSFSTHVINNPYQQRRPADPKREPVYTKTSIYGEYAIYTHPQLHYLLYHNGIPRSARSKSEQLARLLSIQIPILLHPSIHRVLITAPTDGIELMAATCNTLSHIQVLQADPTLIQTAYVYLNGVYNQAFNHPSVRWSTVDFSTYTQLGQSNFDMIWVPLIGTANPKFYEQEADPSVWITSLKQKLNNSGIITCLVDLRFVSLASFNELVTQFAHLFAHLTIWEAERGFQYLILASDTPLHCSLFELDRRYNQPGNFRLFRSYGFEESEEIICRYLTNTSGYYNALQHATNKNGVLDIEAFYTFQGLFAEPYFLTAEPPLLIPNRHATPVETQAWLWRTTARQKVQQRLLEMVTPHDWNLDPGVMDELYLSGAAHMEIRLYLYYMYGNGIRSWLQQLKRDPENDTAIYYGEDLFNFQQWLHVHEQQHLSLEAELAQQLGNKPWARDIWLRIYHQYWMGMGLNPVEIASEHPILSYARRLESLGFDQEANAYYLWNMQGKMNNNK